jgi:glycosyltransferase involved in cell wall biosynthesis
VSLAAPTPVLPAPPADIPQIRRAVIIDWQLSSYFGWGVNGLNFALNWTLQQNEALLTTIPVNEAMIDLNPLEWARIRPALQRSAGLQAELAPLRGQQVTLNVPLLHALGNELAGMPAAVQLAGTPSIALAVFESTALGAAHRERAKPYAVTIVASEWNRSLLEAAGIGPIALAPEGIDPTAFHPAPRADLFPGRFTVYSGGKLEYRKAQDLIVKAFAIFARRHPDALLVTTWASPWPQLARTLNVDPALVSIDFTPDGKLDITGWVTANGIPADQFLAIGSLPNSAMPRIYREMDVALFASRCEGGTNMVAMECMACGVPVILSANTGHLDLIAPGRCYALDRQTPLDGAERIGWGESSVDEIVATLEAAYADREQRRAIGMRGAAFMRTRTWAETTRLRAVAIAPYV